MPPAAEFLDTTTVAMRLRIPYDTCLRLCLTGKLVARKEGRYFRIDARSVEEFERRAKLGRNESSSASR